MSVFDTEPKEWRIEEQIITDRVTGLTFQFEVLPDSKVPYRLRVFGELPFGNRELEFDERGEFAGAGTCLRGDCKPTWTCKVDL